MDLTSEAIKCTPTTKQRQRTGRMDYHGRPSLVQSVWSARCVTDRPERTLAGHKYRIDNGVATAIVPVPLLLMFHHLSTSTVDVGELTGDI